MAIGRTNAGGSGAGGTLSVTGVAGSTVTVSNSDKSYTRTLDSDGKCTEYIEGYRFVPAGQTWTREDGEEFTGRMIAPWRDIRQYDDEQQQYLLDQLTAARAESADMQAALAILGVTNETEEST